MRVGSQKEKLTLLFQLLECFSQPRLPLNVEVWIFGDSWKVGPIGANLVTLGFVVVRILPHHTRINILGKLQIGLVLDQAGLDQIKTVSDHRHLTTVKVRHHGPVGPLFVHQLFTALGPV